ncbi:hypothetical protein HanIR_Chr15g0785951 [Helianthus annuus]|nr:hypothetical protein HanIR_Chr15g0785951 [Helianthus annuus]
MTSNFALMMPKLRSRMLLFSLRNRLKRLQVWRNFDFSGGGFPVGGDIPN